MQVSDLSLRGESNGVYQYDLSPICDRVESPTEFIAINLHITVHISCFHPKLNSSFE